MHGLNRPEMIVLCDRVWSVKVHMAHSTPEPEADCIVTLVHQVHFGWCTACWVLPVHQEITHYNSREL